MLKAIPFLLSFVAGSQFGGPRNDATHTDVHQNPQTHANATTEQNSTHNSTHNSTQNSTMQQHQQLNQAPQIKTATGVTINNDTKPNVTIIFTSSSGPGSTVEHDLNASQHSAMNQEHREHKVESTKTTHASSFHQHDDSESGNSKNTHIKNTPSLKKSDALPQTSDQPMQQTFYSSVRKQHPWKAVVTASLLGTCFIFYILRATEHMILQKDQWCNWKEEIPTKNLTHSEELATALIMDIQKRYTTTKNAHDFIEPLQTFLNDIEEEKTALTWYLKLSSCMHKIYVGKLFGINDLSIQQANDRLQRVENIKKIFVLWTAEYKLGSHSFSTIQNS